MPGTGLRAGPLLPILDFSCRGQGEVVHLAGTSLGLARLAGARLGGARLGGTRLGGTRLGENRLGRLVSLLNGTLPNGTLLAGFGECASLTMC